MKVKRALFIHLLSGEGYWASTMQPGASIGSKPHYFRGGKKTLYWDTPTYFTTKKAAREALEAMGFKLAEQPR